MIILIVESPGKIHKIEGILGHNYKVIASYGHIMDLDPHKMSIDVKNDFAPTYIINHDKGAIVKNLKLYAKNADDIFIASDEDREGEMIAWSVADVLKLKKAKRITFNSITKAKLLEAIKAPRAIDVNLVNAQKTRRLLDRIVGYELSPLLDKHLEQKRLSAGRVQSVVARLVVDRENEITSFMASESQSFFKVKGIFLSESKQPFNAQLHDLTGKDNKGIFKGNPSKINEKDDAKELLEQCKVSEFKVENVFSKKRTQGPSPPFTTSTLQQEANRKFGFTGKRTMMSAQKLYEAGYITYMRTDSVNLSEEALENIKKFVVEKYGNEYYRKMEYKSKAKNTQEAHEAIRPTDAFTVTVPENPENKIMHDEIKLYSLIWKRTVASQMKPAEYNVTSIQMSISESEAYFFLTNIENLTFNGFLAVYNVANIEENDDEEDGDGDTNKNITIPKVGDLVNNKNITATQEYLRPPGRYDEASLIDKLDPKNLNIGRPATYVPIINKIIERKYVKFSEMPGVAVSSVVMVLEDEEISESEKEIVLGKEKNKLVPTFLGIMVTNFLVLNFPKIMDYKFTAEMEDKLDDIANGNLVWTNVLREFYDEFHPTVTKMIFTNPDITKLLGVDPITGFEIFTTMIKNDPLVKLACKPGKPKYARIDAPFTCENMTLEKAIELLEFPKIIGKYNKAAIVINKGKDSYYIKCGTTNFNVEKNNLSEAEAIELIKKKEVKALKTIKNGDVIYSVLDGPFGKYINVNNMKTKKKFNVKLPENENVDKLTVARVSEIVTGKFNKPVNKENDEKKVIVKKVVDKEIDDKKDAAINKSINKAKKKKIIVK